MRASVRSRSSVAVEWSSGAARSAVAGPLGAQQLFLDFCVCSNLCSFSTDGSPPAPKSINRMAVCLSYVRKATDPPGSLH